MFLCPDGSSFWSQSSNERRLIVSVDLGELPRGCEEARLRPCSATRRWKSDVSVLIDQRHRGVTGNSCSLALLRALDEEVGAAELSCGLTEPAREEQRQRGS